MSHFIDDVVDDTPYLTLGKNHPSPFQINTYDYMYMSTQEIFEIQLLSALRFVNWGPARHTARLEPSLAYHLPGWVREMIWC